MKRYIAPLFLLLLIPVLCFGNGADSPVSARAVFESLEADAEQADLEEEFLTAVAAALAAADFAEAGGIGWKSFSARPRPVNPPPEI